MLVMSLWPLHRFEICFGAASMKAMASKMTMTIVARSSTVALSIIIANEATMLSLRLASHPRTAE